MHGLWLNLSPSQVPGAEVMVYRIRCPVRGDNLPLPEYDDGVLDAPAATLEVSHPLDHSVIGELLLGSREARCRGTSCKLSIAYGMLGTYISSLSVTTVRFLQDVLAADALILGAPGRQGGMCGEMRLFLDSLAHCQLQRNGSAVGALKVCESGLCRAGMPARCVLTFGLLLGLAGA